MFPILFPLTSNFQLEKIRYVQFNEIVLQSNNIAFQKKIRIKKISKIDRATSILMGGYGVKLTIFYLLADQFKYQDFLSRELTLLRHFLLFIFCSVIFIKEILVLEILS